MLISQGENYSVFMGLWGIPIKAQSSPKWICEEQQMQQLEWYSCERPIYLFYLIVIQYNKKDSETAQEYLQWSSSCVDGQAIFKTSFDITSFNENFVFNKMHSIWYIVGVFLISEKKKKLGVL